MSSIFDGLPAVFASTFGRPVVYTPVATGVPLPGFDAIFTRRPIEISLGGDGATDGEICTLDVPVASVAAPADGDLVTVPANGAAAAEGTFRIVPPIRPDGEGMITCMLERTT